MVIRGRSGRRFKCGCEVREKRMGGELCQDKAHGRKRAYGSTDSGLSANSRLVPERRVPKQKPPKKTAKSAPAADNRAKPFFTDMSTAEATVATLIAHGIDTVYALPGVHNDHLFDAFQRAGNGVRVVHSRHEQGAAYMALGAALATGKPQAYAVVPGPGLLNTGAALLTAYSMNAPVLALIGQIPEADIGRGYGHLHEVRDQAGIIARLVDFSARIRA